MRQRHPHSILEKDLTPDKLDAGKRASDLINGMLTFYGWDQLRTKLVAIRLSDGGSDGVVYDNRLDAARFQLHEQQCYYCYFRGLGPAGAKPLEMAIVLEMQRKAYQSGVRFIDPDQPNGGPELLMTTAGLDSIRASLIQAGRGRLHHD